MFLLSSNVFANDLLTYTVNFGQNYKFSWGRNHTNDNIYGYRIYESTESMSYIHDQIIFDVNSLQDDIVCSGMFPDGECISQYIMAGNIEKDLYYIVTAVDNYSHESDWSNEVLIQIRNNGQQPNVPINIEMIFPQN